MVLMLLGKLANCFRHEDCFVTQEDAGEIVREAISIGASGYVVKMDIGRTAVRCEYGSPR
jgi:hypothetical protein